MAAVSALPPSALRYDSSAWFHNQSLNTNQQESPKTRHVPPGFPSHYTGERVWIGSEMAARVDEWIIHLSEEDQAHIVKALQHFKGLNLEPGSMSRDTFPLPQELGQRLRIATRDCYDGRGFAVLRGIKPGMFTDEENVLVFAGISSYVAPERGFQDVNRERVTCHVVSEELRPGAEEQKLRPAFTNGRLAFHTDIGEILALYTLHPSDNGGKTMIASSSQIFNELALTRPDLLHELSEKWVFLNSQDYDTDGTPLITNVNGDKLSFQFSRLPVTGFRTEAGNPTIPSITPARLEAMDMVEDLAWKFALPLPCEAGDIAYINNLCLVHARTAFDLDDASNPLPSERHLVKFMLRDRELAWSLPDSLSWMTERVYGPNEPDGSRREKWQLSIRRGESLLDGKIWAGAGSAGNG